MPIKLRKKVSSNGHTLLYLDIHHHGQRWKEFVKGKWIYTKPITPDQRQHNAEIMAVAKAMQSMREHNLLFDGNVLPIRVRDKKQVLPYMEAYRDSLKLKCLRKIKGCIQHFNDYAGQFITFSQLNDQVSNGFADYLRERFGADTCRGYFQAYKRVLKKAYREKLSAYNPNDFKLEKPFKIDRYRITKELLNADEVKALYRTASPNQEIKRAFLLSLNTGLDFKTISTLTHDLYDGRRLITIRSKTDVQNFIELNSVAIEQLGTPQRNSKALIFNLPGTWNGCIKALRKWAKSAGIHRNITWHSARHSFATNLVAKGVDIRIIQELLGHSNISQTIKYTKVSSILKKDAVNKLLD